jgi:hypothetical protein
VLVWVGSGQVSRQSPGWVRLDEVGLGWVVLRCVALR